MNTQICYAYKENHTPKFKKHLESFLRDQGMVLDTYETRCFGIDREDPIHISALVLVGLLILGLSYAVYYFRRKYKLHITRIESDPEGMRPLRVVNSNKS